MFAYCRKSIYDRVMAKSAIEAHHEFKREFNILGQNIVIKNKAEADLAELALKIVNVKIDELQKIYPMMGPHQVSVLALLEIAGNLVKDRKTIDDYREELDQKCIALMNEVKKMEC
jgi:cell division protein ZapA (FtsZ GTPase activity inhibitor)